MKKILFVFLIFFLLAFFVYPKFINTALAATFKFDKTSVNIGVNETFQLEVSVDSAEEEIRSVDAYISYDGSLLEVISVSDGDFFPTIIHDTSTSGQVYIAAMVDDPATSKKGLGKIATITFKGKTNATTTITFNCQSSKIIKADTNATNIIDCSAFNTSTVTIGTGGAGQTSPTPTPTPSITSLPKSGIFDNVQKALKPGIILIILGGALRLLLL